MFAGIFRRCTDAQEVSRDPQLRQHVQVPMPPGLAAASRPPPEFDFEFERQVMAAEASTSFDAFLAKPEVCY